MEPKKNIIQRMIAYKDEKYNNFILRKMEGVRTYSEVYHGMKHYGYKSTTEYAQANAIEILFEILFGRD